MTQVVMVEGIQLVGETSDFLAHIHDRFAFSTHCSSGKLEDKITRYCRLNQDDNVGLTDLIANDIA